MEAHIVGHPSFQLPNSRLLSSDCVSVWPPHTTVNCPIWPFRCCFSGVSSLHYHDSLILRNTVFLAGQKFCGQTQVPWGWYGSWRVQGCVAFLFWSVCVVLASLQKGPGLLMFLQLKKKIFFFNENKVMLVQNIIKVLKETKLTPDLALTLILSPSHPNFFHMSTS